MNSKKRDEIKFSDHTSSCIVTTVNTCEIVSICHHNGINIVIICFTNSEQEQLSKKKNLKGIVMPAQSLSTVIL
jgi:hypothetical protein